MKSLSKVMEISEEFLMICTNLSNRLGFDS